MSGATGEGLTSAERDAYAAPGTSLREALDGGELPWPTRADAVRELMVDDLLSTGSADGPTGVHVSYREELTDRVSTCPFTGDSARALCAATCPRPACTGKPDAGEHPS